MAKWKYPETAFFCLLAVCAKAFATDVVQPSSSAAEAVEGSGTALVDDESVFRFFSVPLRLKYGPVALHPHLSYRYLHADGVQSQPGETHSSSIQTFSPGLAANIGDSWTVDYTPSWTYYSESAFENNVSHSLSLTGHMARDEWAGSLRHSARYTSTPLVETGRQTKQENHSTVLQLQREIGSAWNLDVSLKQNLRYAKTFADTRDRGIDNWLRYQVFDWLQTSAGFSYAYQEADNTPDTVVTGYRGQVSMRTSDKLSAQIHGGIEERDVRGPKGDHSRAPVYGVAILYRIFEPTTFGISGDRGTNSSFFRNEVVRSETWSAVLSQRLLQRFTLSLAASTYSSRYTSVFDGSALTRKDSGQAYRAALTTSIFRRGSASIFYSRGQNRSSQSAFEFVSHQYGLSLSFRL